MGEQQRKRFRRRAGDYAVRELAYRRLLDIHFDHFRTP